MTSKPRSGVTHRTTGSSYFFLHRVVSECPEWVNQAEQVVKDATCVNLLVNNWFVRNPSSRRPAIEHGQMDNPQTTCRHHWVPEVYKHMLQADSPILPWQIEVPGESRPSSCPEEWGKPDHPSSPQLRGDPAAPLPFASTLSNETSISGAADA